MVINLRLRGWCTRGNNIHEECPIDGMIHLGLTLPLPLPHRLHLLLLHPPPHHPRLPHLPHHPRRPPHPHPFPHHPHPLPHHPHRPPARQMRMKSLTKNNQHPIIF